MKFFIFLGLLVAAIGLGVRECKRRDLSPGSLVVGAATSFVPEAPPSPSSSPGPSSLAPGELPSPGLPASPISPAGADPLAGPSSWDVVIFEHREPPPAEYFAQWATVGVQAIVDPVTRSVTLRGNQEAVHRCVHALRGIDQVPGSCSVKAWAVYVDRSVTKGFDLVAAIGAVLDAPDVLRIGNGSLTLDVDAGSLQAALEVIADGSAVEVLQNPHVRLVHGSPATVEAIQEIPLPSTVLSNGIAQTSVQFRKVGLQLEIQPQFLAMDRVRLGIRQTNGLVGDSAKFEGGSEIPIIESQTVSSTAEFTIGQSLVLGGVRTIRQRRSRGLLKDVTELREGSMYVILSSYFDEPKAIPLDAAGFPLPASLESHGAVPFSRPAESGAEWIDDGLLPPKGWQSQERDFLQRRGHPSH